MTANGSQESEKEARARELADRELAARLHSLEHRIVDESRQQAHQTSLPVAEGEAKLVANGIRLTSEFAAGVLVGAALGWGLDWLLGTSPLGLIVMIIVGCAAGMFNMARSSGALGRS